jgi:hypothetical protein
MVGTIRIEGDDLIFELHGVDQILAIKRSISVPLAHVTSVSTDAVPWKAFQQLKAGGTSLPGVIKDGRFVDQNGMMFFEMHHPDKCITVNLDHETYKQIVFEVDDKEAAAQMIRGVLPPHG